MTKHTILFLASNPIGIDRLALEDEARQIRVELERSGLRDRFDLVVRPGAQPLDLLDTLRKLKPTVVHFSGRGARGDRGEPRTGEAPSREIVTADHQPGLCFQDHDGSPKVVSTEAIKDAFEAAGGSVKLVVLNACYSETQAEALRLHVDCVVGMAGSIGDDAARSFAVGFYGGLGERASVAAAYRQGRVAIRLESLPDHEQPRLVVRNGVDPDRIILAEIGQDAPHETMPTAKTAVPQGTAEPRQPEPLRFLLRRRSTVESVKVGDVSALAIAETGVATGLFAWLAWRSGPPSLAMTVCGAVLCVLRTPSSVTTSWEWYHKLFSPREREQTRSPLVRDRSDPFERIIILLVAPVLVSVRAVINATKMIGIRAGATVLAVVCHPLETARAIPRNWLRAGLCVDSLYPLEMLPEAHEKYGDAHDGITQMTLLPIRGIVLQVRNLRDNTERFVSFVTLPVFLIVYLVPALLYRWYLKASLIVYSPFMFVFLVTGKRMRTFRVHVRDIVGRAPYRFARYLAVLVLVLFIAKCLIYLGWDELAPGWRTLPGHHLLDAVVMPSAFPPWQYAIAISAAMVWLIYGLAEWVNSRLEGEPDDVQPAHKDVFESILHAHAILQWFLYSYVFLCGMYLLSSLSGRLPPMGTRIVPWWQ